MISKTTVFDLLKIAARLREFFEQEFRSGKRMLSSLQSRRNQMTQDEDESSGN